MHEVRFSTRAKGKLVEEEAQRREPSSSNKGKENELK